LQSEAFVDYCQEAVLGQQIRLKLKTHYHSKSGPSPRTHKA